LRLESEIRAGVARIARSAARDTASRRRSGIDVVALSSTQTRQLSRGLAAAAVAGALYVASRRRAAGPPPSLIDWEKVRTIATLIARRDSHSYEDVRSEYAVMVRSRRRIIYEAAI